MHINRRWSLLALVAVPYTIVMGVGCQSGPPDPNLAKLAGVWALTRGAIHVTISWAAGDGEDVKQDSNTGQLQPIDVDNLPDEIKPLGQQWNDNLAALNAELDKAFPAEVIVTFPRVATMRVENAADPTKVGEGLINGEYKYLFAGDWSGAGEGSDQGGGAVLQVATIDGEFDVGALTTTGKVARTLVVALFGQQGGIVLSVQISVDYTGQRTGDVPPEPELPAE